MRAVWDQHLITTLASAAVVGLDHAQAGPLAVRAGSRLKAHALHGGQGEQRPLQLPHEAQRALRARRRAVRMQVGEIVEAGPGPLDGPGIFSLARTPRIETPAQAESWPAHTAETA